MNKLPGKYFLSLCILLLSVYGLTYAYSSNKNSGVVTNTSETSFKHCFRPVANNQPQVRDQFPSDFKHSFGTYGEKNEEESFRLIFNKTYTHIGNYFTRFFSCSLNIIFLNNQKRLPRWSHWFRTSTRRYSALCDYRI